MPRRESKKTKPPIETPWGPSQTVIAYTDGIDFFSCAGHGGFRLSTAKTMEMPAELRSFVGYGGRGWYEEDCDWAIVAIAFPDYFEPSDIFDAERTCRQYHKAETEAFFKTPSGQEIIRIADRYLAENGTKYRGAGGGSGDHGSWNASYRRVDQEDPTIILNVPRGEKEPESRLYTYDELVAMGGKPINFNRPQAV